MPIDEKKDSSVVKLSGVVYYQYKNMKFCFDSIHTITKNVSIWGLTLSFSRLHQLVKGAMRVGHFDSFFFLIDERFDEHDRGL